MPARPPMPKTPAWSVPIEDQFWLNNVLRLYAAFNLWIIRSDGKKIQRWWQISSPSLRPEPHHFDSNLESPHPRADYQLECIKRVFRSRKPLLAEYKGFSDLILPLPGPAGDHAVLFAGQFSRKLPDEAMLKRRWSSMTGLEPSDQNPVFLAYVRAALNLPLLDREVLRGMMGLLQDYAAMLAGRPGAPGIYLKAQRLREQILSRHLPHPYWAALALSYDKDRIAPWAAKKELADYEKQELGISRVPTTVMALIPVEPSVSPGGVAAMLRNARLQHECFLVARQLPETVTEKLGDHGMLFLTSADPRKSAGLARQELRKRAEEIGRLLRRRLGLDTVIAVGGSRPPGEALRPSFREAVSALEHCLFPRKALLFHDELPAQKSQPLSRLQRSAARLADAVESLAPDDLSLALEAFIHSAEDFAPRLDQARARFMDMLMRLQDLQCRQGRLEAHQNEALLADFFRRCEEAASGPELAGHFRECVQALLRRAPRGSEAAKASRLAPALAFLEGNYRKSISLAQMARHAGLSVSVFCEAFKKSTGMSLSPYLQALRVTEAKRLLRNSRQSIDDIAAHCGFHSTRHFQRIFKKISGRQPKAYRRASKEDSA